MRKGIKEEMEGGKRICREAEVREMRGKCRVEFYRGRKVMGKRGEEEEKKGKWRETLM